MISLHHQTQQNDMYGKIRKVSLQSRSEATPLLKRLIEQLKTQYLTPDVQTKT